MSKKITGQPLTRIDGRLKVTGQAKYAAEFNQNQMAYAFPVRSTIGKGSITAIDAGAAQSAGGVLTVITHENAMRLKELKNPMELLMVGGLLGENLSPLQDNKVHYFGQYIALVVAETYEQARNAAALVKVTYSKEPIAVELAKELPKGFKPQQMFGEKVQINEGKAAPVIASSPVKIEQTYHTSNENHHPMEPHATVAIWEADDKLMLYDATQGVKGVQGVSAFFFNLKSENVKVKSPFVGGGFGCKGGQWANILLTAMAAKAVKRPVKFALTRQMMVTNVGRRGETMQKIALAAGKDGKLTAMRHHSDTYTNLSDFFEPSGKQTNVLYNSPIRARKFPAFRPVRA